MKHMYRDYAEEIERKFESARKMLECLNSGSVYQARASIELKKNIESAYASFYYMRAMGCWESVTSTQKLLNSAIDCFQLLRKTWGYKCNQSFLRVGRCLYDIQCILNMIEYNELGVF